MNAPKAPPGVNLADNNGPSILAGMISLMVVSTLFLLARFAARRIKKAPLIKSDWALIVGWLFTMGTSSTLSYGSTIGLGQHIEVVTPAHLRLMFIVFFCGEIFYTLSITAIKLSILFLIGEIFPRGKLQRALQFMGAYVTMWGIAVLLVTIFSCNPVNGYWDFDIPSKCISSETFLIANGSTNILADLIIISLPIKRVWDLHLPATKRVAICGMFLTGGFVIIASCIRMAELLLMDVSDVTWTFVGAGLWSATESNVAIISACLPTMLPLIKYFLNGFRAERPSATGNSRSYSRRANKVRGNGASSETSDPGSDDFVARADDKRWLTSPMGTDATDVEQIEFQNKYPATDDLTPNHREVLTV